MGNVNLYMALNISPMRKPKEEYTRSLSSAIYLTNVRTLQNLFLWRSVLLLWE